MTSEDFVYSTQIRWTILMGVFIFLFFVEFERRSGVRKLWWDVQKIAV